MKKMNEKQQEAYNIFALKMDLDYVYKQKLVNWFMKYDSLPVSEQFEDPDHNQKTFDNFMKDKCKSWRSMPRVVKRIKKSARKAGYAKGLDAIKKKDREAWAKEKLHHEKTGKWQTKLDIAAALEAFKLLQK